MAKYCKDCSKAKHRNVENKEALIKRLNIVEGQIRGIREMVEKDRCCDEILTQISASMHSIKSIGNSLLNDHLSTCVKSDIENGKSDAINDVADLYEKLNR